MKKLLLPLTFICFIMSSNVMAQRIDSAKVPSKKTVAPGTKMSKNNAVVRINEVPPTPSFTSRSSNSNVRKQRIVEAGTRNRNSVAKVSHREMIAKRKKIVEQY